MMVVREKANLICQGRLQRGAVLPIMLATFIFEVLCYPGKASKETNNDQQRKMDEDIGYMAAFCALGGFTFYFIIILYIFYFMTFADNLVHSSL